MNSTIDRVLRAVLVLALALSVAPAAQAQMPSAKAKAQSPASAKPSGITERRGENENKKVRQVQHDREQMFYN